LPRKVIIVESPTKAKSIYQMLEGEYLVKATLGHIKDLPEDKMGVEIKLGPVPDVSFDLNPIKGKAKLIKELRDACNGADVYIASDPDREGEAIAYHVYQEVSKTSRSTRRIRFGAITKEEVSRALKNPDKININQVRAQALRRILDRVVGYEFSPLASRNLGQSGCSVGRVQTAVLGLIEARENEINNFVPEPYWHVTVTDSNGTVFQSDRINDKNLAQKVLEAAKAGGGITVSDVSRSSVKETAPKPLTASTMQQMGNKRFGWDSSKTMKIAQSLFEKEHLITYMRTDSVRLSPEEQEKALRYLGEEYPDLVPENPIQHKNSNKTQDAHECIHPTYMLSKYHPRCLKNKLSEDEWKLYDLIWNFFFASQSKPAVWDVVKVEGRIKSSAPEVQNIAFTAKGKSLVFEGWRRFLPSRDRGEMLVGEYRKGQVVAGDSIALEEKKTVPPPRYNNASLVAAMEKHGIGRPSTYASVVSTLKGKQYISEENKNYRLTVTGKKVLEWAKQVIPEIVNVDFTAKVEEILDKVELGEADWKKNLADFYKNVVLAGVERAKKLSRISLTPEEEEALAGIAVKAAGKRSKARDWGGRGKGYDKDKGRGKNSSSGRSKKSYACSEIKSSRVKEKKPRSEYEYRFENPEQAVYR